MIENDIGVSELDYELTLNVDTRQNSVDNHACKTTEGLAECIRRGNHFAQDGGGHLYYYKNGVYKEDAEKAIKLAVVQLLAAFHQPIAWSTHKEGQAFNYIKIQAPKLLDCPDVNRINLLNGIYDVKKGELLPHNPNYRTTVQLNVWYDANAKCPAWEKFINETFLEEEDRITLFDIPAWLMTPFTDSQKAVVFEGEGSNGKSIYIDGITQFLGEQNICNVSMQKLGDRFTTTLLIGKLANISPDLPDIKLQSTGEFKALTGGDSLAAEYKHGAQFKFKPFARCLFACNAMPATTDVSEGFYRRLNIIKFEQHFDDDPIMKKKLNVTLGSKEELAGLFNKCVGLLPKVWERGITVTKRMEEALNNHRKENDPVAQWLEETVTYREGEWIEKKELFKEYQASGNKGSAARSQVWFGRAVMKYIEGVEVKQVKEFERVIGVYYNLTRKTEIDKEGILEVDLENDPDFGEIEDIISDNVNFPEGEMEDAEIEA
jgi:putative DNA primase/helicase